MVAPNLQVKAEKLGGGAYVDWLIEKLGPMLSDLLLDLMMKRAEPAFMQKVNRGTVQFGATTGNGIDLSLMVVALIQKFGPQLIASLVSQLSARPDAGSKLFAQLLQSAGPQILSLLVSLLQTPQGMASLNSALDEAQKQGALPDIMFGDNSQTDVAALVNELLGGMLGKLIPLIVQIINDLFNTPHGMAALNQVFATPRNQDSPGPQGPHNPQGVIGQQ